MALDGWKEGWVVELGYSNQKYVYYIHFSLSKVLRQNPFQFIFPWLRILSYLAGFPVKMGLTSCPTQKVLFNSSHWLTVYHWLNLFFGWGLICAMVALMSQAGFTLHVSTRIEIYSFILSNNHITNNCIDRGLPWSNG